MLVILVNTVDDETEDETEDPAEDGTGATTIKGPVTLAVDEPLVAKSDDRRRVQSRNEELSIADGKTDVLAEDGRVGMFNVRKVGPNIESKLSIADGRTDTLAKDGSLEMLDDRTGVATQSL